MSRRPGKKSRNAGSIVPPDGAGLGPDSLAPPPPEPAPAAGPRPRAPVTLVEELAEVDAGWDELLG